MKLILEIDHTINREEIESWIKDVLLPDNPCVWGYSFEEHHCGNCSKSENEELKAQIEKMKCCGNCKKRNSCIKHNNFVYPEMTNPINYNCYDLDKWECAE